MKNLKKITLLVVVLLLALSVKTFAMTQDELVEYVTKEHTINGTTYKAPDRYKRELENYLIDHPITDAQADEMKTKFDNLLAYINSLGKTHIKDLTKSEKQTLLDKANEITAIVNVTVKYNATDKTIEFYDADGKKITALPVEDYDTLVQTGSSNYDYAIVAGIVAVVAIAGVVVYKKSRA